MAAFVLTLIFSVFLGSAVWFVVGSRFNFREEEAPNDLMNWLALVGGSIPIAFVLVFFGLG